MDRVMVTTGAFSETASGFEISDAGHIAGDGFEQCFRFAVEPRNTLQQALCVGVTRLGKKLMDVRKVNYVILGGDNAGEHLLM